MSLPSLPFYITDLAFSSEITDSTNMAQGFAMMPVMWSIGGTVGYVRGVAIELYQADALHSDHSSAVSWLNRTTGGLTFSQILFGNIILISFHVPLRRFSLQ